MAELKLTDTELAELATLLAPRVQALIGPPPPAARLLYRNDFNSASIIRTADVWDKGEWLDFVWADGRSAPNLDPSLGNDRLLSLTDPLPPSAGTISQAVVPAAGRLGTPALVQTITGSANGTAPMGGAATQAALQLLPLQDVPRLYARLWIKLQKDLVDKMAASPGGWAWRQLLATKTGSQLKSSPANDGDQRVQLAIQMDQKERRPFWVLGVDNNAGGPGPVVPYVTLANLDVPVPAGEWMDLEFAWQRGSAGRVAAAVNGNVLFDWRGELQGAHALPINRIFLPILYSGSAFPISQTVDQLEVWSGVPEWSVLF